MPSSAELVLDAIHHRSSSPEDEITLAGNQPPFSLKPPTSPVTKLPLAKKNMTGSATASGVDVALNAPVVSIRFLYSLYLSVPIPFSSQRPWMKPGQTAFTRMAGPRERARERVRVFKAPKRLIGHVRSGRGRGGGCFGQVEGCPIGKVRCSGL